MTDNKWGEAKDILKELQQFYPDHKDEIRQLFARVFDAETANTLPPRNVEKEITNHSTKGGNNQTDKDFWGVSSKEKKNLVKGGNSNVSNDDFFDSYNHVKTPKKDKRVIKNDEFDF